MANDRLTQITNQIREKRIGWPPNLPTPQFVIVNESHLPDDFDPDVELLDGLKVVTTLQIRKNSVRLAISNEALQ
jgi:hypothetical protein